MRMRTLASTYRTHSTTEMPCAMTVATAAPRTPMPTPAMNHRSSPTFSAELMSRNTSGITLLPMARSRPAHRLYINMTTTPRSITMM